MSGDLPGDRATLDLLDAIKAPDPAKDRTAFHLWRLCRAVALARGEVVDVGSPFVGHELSAAVEHLDRLKGLPS